jgi:hypothetical protein
MTLRLNHISSSKNGKCIVCNRRSGTWGEFRENEVSVVVPICDEHYNRLSRHKGKMGHLVRFLRQLLREGE